MSEKDLMDKVNEIRSGMRWIDAILNVDYKTGGGTITETQVDIVQKVLDLLQELNWQLALNQYKELKYKDGKAIDTRKCGTPVKIRSCRPEHGDKTYFGIFLGDMATSIGHSIKGETLTASFSGMNPAIFVPELNTIIMGCESWWGEIKSEEEMSKLITDDTIKNVWYVKALTEMLSTKTQKSTPEAVVETPAKKRNKRKTQKDA